MKAVGGLLLPSRYVCLYNFCRHLCCTDIATVGTASGLAWPEQNNVFAGLLKVAAPFTANDICDFLIGGANCRTDMFHMAATYKMVVVTSSKPTVSMSEGKV